MCGQRTATPRADLLAAVLQKQKTFAAAHRHQNYSGINGPTSTARPTIIKLKN